MENYTRKIGQNNMLDINYCSDMQEVSINGDNLPSGTMGYIVTTENSVFELIEIKDFSGRYYFHCGSIEYYDKTLAECVAIIETIDGE